MVLCTNCKKAPPQIKRSKSQELHCTTCFFQDFENEVHQTITRNRLFEKGDKVAVAVSGGKDSTVLAYILKLLNDRYCYGLDLRLLAIDEGIATYRDASLLTVNSNMEAYGIPLTVKSFQELYGYTMDDVVSKIGQKHNCTYCGIFRRQAMDKGALSFQATKLCTGHNLDDAAETVLINIFRGDINRFQRCSGVVTGRESNSEIPRSKPLMNSTQKEIVLYAHFKKLLYFSMECIYAKNAYRNSARGFVKILEQCNPQYVSNLIIAISHLKATTSETEVIKLKSVESVMGSHLTKFVKPAK